MAPQTPNSAPKAMSSRLLTMKFMQRAAAASAPSSATSTPDGRPAKRQRLFKGSSAATPTPFSPSESEAILAALAEEDRKRSEAIEKQAAAAGETKWTLNIVEPPHWKASNIGLQVEYVGWSAIDASDSEGDELDSEGEEGVSKRSMVKGRMVFRKATANGKSAKPHTKAKQRSDSDNEAKDSEEEYDPATLDPTTLIRDERNKAEQSSRDGKRQRDSDETPIRPVITKPLNLDHITSTSDTLEWKPDSWSLTESRRESSVKCSKCGQMGHYHWQCERWYKAKTCNVGGLWS